MNSRKLSRILLLALAVFSYHEVVHAQASSSATSVRRTIDVGAGFTRTNMDWAHQHMEGITVWADFHVLPGRLARIAPEFQFKNIPWGNSNQIRLSQRTIQGGLKADLFTYGRLHLYAKGLIGTGHIEFNLGAVPARPELTSRNDTVYTAAGGGEFRMRSHLNIRAEYYEEFWPNLALRNTSLTPSGFTIGVSRSF